ncbi:hypothetical protein VE04_04657 [Pseudogymnoascus sp. 24MN13]|nr:hypothetical protein VE04_04657 [Pseudogymnoascus sp. 24MN13]
MSLAELSRLTHRGNTDTFGLVVQEVAKKQVRRSHLLVEAVKYDEIKKIKVETIIDRATVDEQKRKNAAKQEVVNSAIRQLELREEEQAALIDEWREIGTQKLGVQVEFLKNALSKAKTELVERRVEAKTAERKCTAAEAELAPVKERVTELERELREIKSTPTAAAAQTFHSIAQGMIKGCANDLRVSEMLKTELRLKQEVEAKEQAILQLKTQLDDVTARLSLLDETEGNGTRVELLDENRELRLTIEDLNLTATTNLTTISCLREEVARLKATGSHNSAELIDIRGKLTKSKERGREAVTSATNLSHRVIELEADLTQKRLKVSRLETKEAVMSDRMTGLKHTVGTDAITINNQKVEIARLEVVASTASEANVLNAKLMLAVDTLKRAASSHEVAIAEIKGQNSTLAVANTSLRAELSLANERVTAAAGSASISKAAASVDAKMIANLRSEIQGLENQASTMKTAISEFERKEAKLTEEIHALKGTASNVADLEKDNAKLTEEIQALKTMASMDLAAKADLEKDKAALMDEIQVLKTTASVDLAAKAALTADISFMKDAAVVFSQEVNELRGRNGLAALTIQELRRERESAALEMDSLQSQVDSAAVTFGEMSGMIDQLEGANAAACGENRRLCTKVGQLTEEMAAAATRVEKLKAHICELQQERSTSMLIHAKGAKFKALSEEYKARVTTLDQEKALSITARDALVAQSAGFEALAKEFQVEKTAREQKVIEIAELRAEAAASTKAREAMKDITKAIGVTNSKYVLDLESTNTDLRTVLSTMTAKAQAAEAASEGLKAKEAGYIARIGSLENTAASDAAEKLTRLQKTVDAAALKLEAIDDASAVTVDTVMTLLERESTSAEAMGSRMARLQRTADAGAEKLSAIDDVATVTAAPATTLLERESTSAEVARFGLGRVERKLCSVLERVSAIDETAALSADAMVYLSTAAEATGPRLAGIECLAIGMDRKMSVVSDRVSVIDEAAALTADSVMCLSAAAESLSATAETTEAMLTEITESTIDIKRKLAEVAVRAATIDDATTSTADSVVCLSTAAESLSATAETTELMLTTITESSMDIKRKLAEVAARAATIDDAVASNTNGIASLSAVTEVAGLRLEDAIKGVKAEVAKRISDEFKLATKEERERIRRERVAEDEEVERRRKARKSVACGTDALTTTTTGCDPITATNVSVACGHDEPSSQSTLSGQDSQLDASFSSANGDSDSSASTAKATTKSSGSRSAQSTPSPVHITRLSLKLDYRLLVAGPVDGGEYATEVNTEALQGIERVVQRLRDSALIWWRPRKNANRCVLHRLDRRQNTTANAVSGETTACYGCSKLNEPCVVYGADGIPTVLPLPENLRSRDATPLTAGFYLMDLVEIAE